MSAYPWQIATSTLKTWVASESLKAADLNRNFQSLASAVNNIDAYNLRSGYKWTSGTFVGGDLIASHAARHAYGGADPLVGTFGINIASGTISNPRILNGSWTSGVLNSCTATGGLTVDALTVTGAAAVNGAALFASNTYFNGQLIHQVGTCTAQSDAANKEYVDTLGSWTLTVVNGIVSILNQLEATDTYILSVLGTVGSSSTLAAHVASTTGIHGVAAGESLVGASGSQTISNKTLENGKLANNFDCENYQLINLATPTAASDAANKGYVDQQIAAVGGAFVGYEILGGNSASGSTLTTTGDYPLTASFTVPTGQVWSVAWTTCFYNPGGVTGSVYDGYVRCWENGVGLSTATGSRFFGYMADNTGKDTVTFQAPQQFGAGTWQLGLTFDTLTFAGGSGLTVISGTLGAMKFTTP